MSRTLTVACSGSELLIQQLLSERARIGYVYSLNESEIGRHLLGASAGEQKAFVLAAAEWLDRDDPIRTYFEHSAVRMALVTLLRRKFTFSEDELLSLMDWCSRQPLHYYWSGIGEMTRTLESYLQSNPLTPPLHERIKRLLDVLKPHMQSADVRRWAARLRELGDILPGEANPLVPGEAWADAALIMLEGMEESRRVTWNELLTACSYATGATPTKKWLKSVEPLLESIGDRDFKDALLAWFPLVDNEPDRLPSQLNADILKGLLWLCPQREDRDIARALAALAVSAYRKIPGVGPRSVRVGNACVWALGKMPGSAGIEQLAILKVKVKFGSAQKGIDKALVAAAERMGLSPEEIEELTVPDYGMQEVGLRREGFGEWTAELQVTGTSSTDLKWIRADGKRQQSAPKAVKEARAAALKELNLAAKDIRKMLPAQSARIENLYLAQKQWPLPAWRERYLDHPLLGILARRLIWTFRRGTEREAGIWHEGHIVCQDGQPLDWLDESTTVELWHPLHETTETVLAWRDWLADHEIQQPFKQAYREIYLLTDAERATHVYSNRFASHILRQHQFNALCAARGWKNRLRLCVDDFYPPATRLLPAWGLRAEYWVEGAGDTYGTDTNESGTFLYLTTDQVRFYPIEAQENYAHASGGGYHNHRWGVDAAPAEPLPLDEIPPLLFSEIMRDVDLFVGVASVGNDPNWIDGGREVRYRDYWTGYSFGELSETAKTRRYVLERLVPRLKIAERCHLTDRFLVVRGQLRAYKIHLGSGNILMEPNDQYLCIVPARGAATQIAGGPMFLPFEGDSTLALILSKAFLLAEDQDIEDPTIVRQIRS